MLGVTPREDADVSFVVVSDPAFRKVMDFTAGLDYAYPGATTVGRVPRATHVLFGTFHAVYSGLDTRARGACPIDVVQGWVDGDRKR